MGVGLVPGVPYRKVDVRVDDFLCVFFKIPKYGKCISLLPKFPISEWDTLSLKCTSGEKIELTD